MKDDWDKSAKDISKGTGLNDLFDAFTRAYEQSSPAEKAAFEEHVKEQGMPPKIARIGLKQIEAERMREIRTKMTPEQKKEEREKRAAHMRALRAKRKQERDFKPD